MKRLSTKLISSSKITTSSTSISGNFTPQFRTCSSSSSSSSSSSISKSPIQNLNPCSNSNGLIYKPFKTHQFHKNPSQNYSTHVGSTPYYVSYVERTPYYVENTPYYKIKKNRSLIQEAVKEAKAATSPMQMLGYFKMDMEDKFDKGKLGAACLTIGFELDKEGEDPQKILSFANKSLALLDNAEENKCCLAVAMNLLLLGSTNRSLSKFDDALGFLNRAKNILVKLEDDCKYEYGVKSVKITLHAVYMELVNVVVGMGRINEAVDYLRKSLVIKKFLMGLDRFDRYGNPNRDMVRFGKANRDFAELCVTMKNFKDGLLCCEKASKMHWDGEEHAREKRLLGVIYAGMEDYEKAFEMHEEAQRSFKEYGCRSDLIRSVTDVANVYIALGRYEAAVNTLKEHEKAVEEDSENPLILMTMGKALVHQDNFEEAKRCFVIACSVLDKEENANPLEVADAYITMADQYEIMNDFETAISLLMRAVSLLEKLPEEQHSNGGVLSRIGSLLLLTGKVTQAKPYLEKGAEIVKESCGYKHLGVGYICNKLGRAYLELERPEAVAEMVVVAKDILDFPLGPHHNESIHTC
ncbi:protein KINESIN LIGHT CHAIN-RELATED 2-like [Silene latifolia]|uniref:protein KINESIN LIGHT CHAIN-RELATED 2-like n=1 Tax=Silene latifolia TaxID=37657 RepID=UPI003D776CE4